MRWNLYENEEFIDSFPSHAAAKKAKHFKIKESYMDCLDIHYEIKPQKINAHDFLEPLGIVE
jgi:hypothetical protein